MGLPQTIRVKLSSEAAEAISVTPVVVQEFALRDLIELMLGMAGKDEARIRELLLRGQPIEISRDAGERKGLFQRGTFWDGLMAIVAEGEAGYAGYSYRDRADRYVRNLGPEEAARVRAIAGTVRFTTLRDQIRLAAFTSAELFAQR